jgi:hypothetical protein
MAAIAGRIGRARDRLDPGRQFRECAPREVAVIARDLGLSANELISLTQRGPDAARLLKGMLAALGLDAKTLADREPIVMRDLQRVCAACDLKRRCEHDLAEHRTEICPDYCPNAYTLNALAGSKRTDVA